MQTEFEFIKQFLKKSAIYNSKSKIRVGIGDDCAVINQNKKTDLVITTDLLIEDVDFRLAWTEPEFIGHKALAVSLSDVAAMGAKPLWALISIGVPSKVWQSGFVEKFYKGWFALAKKFNVELVGGDVSRVTDKIVIDSIVAGEVKKDCAILRSGAKAEDLIFVTGELGGAAAGLNLLENGWRFEKSDASVTQKLLQCQLSPLPQIKIGQLLNKKRLVTAMIDLSDGLSSDLTHLCQSSNVGAKIYADKIPIHRKLKSYQKLSASKKLELNNFSLALDGGEDYQLLFTVKPQNGNNIKKHFKDCSQIGEITADTSKIELINEFITVPIKPNGFQHF